MAQAMDACSSEGDSAEDSLSCDEDVPREGRRPELDQIIATVRQLVQDNRKNDAEKLLLDTYRRIEQSYTSEKDRKYLDYVYYLLQCAGLFKETSNHSLALEAYYTAILHQRDEELNILEHMHCARILWEDYFSSAIQIEDISKIAVKLQITAELDRSKNGGSEYSLAYTCFHSSLLVTFRTLLQSQKAPQCITDKWLKSTLVLLRYRVFHGDASDVVNECKELDANYPENIELLETWAHGLMKIGKMDVALKKVDTALELTKNSVKTQALRDLKTSIIAAMEREKTLHENDVPDSDWLAGTNINEITRNSRRREELKNSHVKHNRSRPKSRKVELVCCFMKTQSWEDVDLGTDHFKEPSWIHNKCARKRKKRRKTVRLRQTNQAADNSSSAKSIEDQSLDESEDDFGEDIQMLESSRFDNSLKLNLDKDDCYEQPSVRSFFDESVQLLNKKDKRYLEEGDVILSGMNLSESFVQSTLPNGKQNKTEYNVNLPVDELNYLLKNQPQKYKRCTLHIQTAHKSICTLIKPESNMTDIEISGRSKCGRNFTEDEVVVKVLTNPRCLRNDKKSSPKVGTVNGEVVGRLIRNRFSNIDHPVFVCEIDSFEYHKMKPLDKTVPKLHLYRKKKNDNNMPHVDIFEYDSKTGNLKFKEQFTIEPTKIHTYVFLVVYIHWEGVYPLGAVTKVMEAEGNLGNGLEILRIQHQIPTTYRPKTVKEANRLVMEQDQAKPDDSSPLEVFTIDPEDSRDLDDAFSMRELPNGEIEIGVHISDVATVVQKGGNIDNEAQFRAMTFYHDKQAYHMLPEPLSQNHCSLVPNQRRRAISTFFRFNSDGSLINGPPSIKKTVVVSRRKFSYEEVQVIVNGNTSCGKFSSQIPKLFQISKHLRRNRLGDAMSCNDKVESCFNTTSNSSDSPEAHYLVEEFMILTNKTIAIFVCSSVPNSPILRCQNAPQVTKVKQWLLKYPITTDLILRLQKTTILPSQQRQLLISNVQQNNEKPIPIEIQSWVWSFLEQCAMKGDFQKAWAVIGCDELHPEQALALREWRSFQELAQYKCHVKSGDFKHFDLRISPYLQCTSPIRRYTDLVNQRLIHAAIDQTPSPYRQDEIEEICIHLNQVSRRAKLFENKCKALYCGHELRNSPTLCNGFVEEITNDKMSIYFPGKKSFTPRSKEIPLKLLNVSRKPEIKQDTRRPLDILSLTWRKRIYSHTGFGRATRFQKQLRIDPHQRATFQEHTRWIDILKACTTRNKTEFKKTMSISAPFYEHDQMRDFVPACTETVNDVSCEERENAIPLQFCQFSVSFNHAQIMSVQLGADIYKGVLEPSPQLLELTNNVKLCLLHTKDPLRYLTKYARRTGNRHQYDTVDSYLKTWLPLLWMEAATMAAKADSITINDVPIKLYNRHGTFKLTKLFCDDRNIKFSCSPIEAILNDGNREEKKENVIARKSSDFLCFKCSYHLNDSSSSLPKDHPERRRIWLAHGQIESIQEVKESDVWKVRFLLHPTSPPPPQQLTNGRGKPLCSVELMITPVSIRRPESALKCLESANSLIQSVALGKSLPISEVDGYSLQTDVDGTKLPNNNHEQNEAIVASLSTDFTLIQGPPGTGKTYTGIKLLYLFTKRNKQLALKDTDRKQIIFCGPSNKSVDHVACRYCYSNKTMYGLVWHLTKKLLGNKAPKFVRVYGSAHECCDYPIPGKINSRKQDQQPDKDLWAESLHHLIRMAGKPHAKEIREYDTYFSKFKGDLPSIKNPEKATEFKTKMKDFKTLKYKAKLEELKHYDVIFCTTTMATNPTIVRAVKDRIGQCIMDECGMCTEPECMAAIIATQAEQVVLIGDHKQLRPVVTCHDAAKLGLETSLFERYSDKAIMLKRQYRMHPSICHFVSTQFYDDMLITEESSLWKEYYPLRLWKDPSHRYIFYHVEGQEEYLTVSTDEGSERSCSNQQEVNQVVKTFHRLVKIEKVQRKCINIMSQYRAQCNAIEKSLGDAGFTGCNVRTVVSSQGGEWDYVIFSTARSLPDYKIEPNPTLGWRKENLGFITDEHQINVALSRARKGLIIIGNRNLLRTDPVWSDLLDYYQEDGCVVLTTETTSKRRR
ncbi:3'-5' exoribonuclease HELZ2-like [Argopecten irradians]|uniref:3'-5' exoribonuclease HELZ2-like n=1 Tax=Argopecten irradians TaxID=31199 RepID=UPI00370FA721